MPIFSSYFSSVYSPENWTVEFLALPQRMIDFCSVCAECHICFRLIYIELAHHTKFDMAINNVRRPNQAANFMFSKIYNLPSDREKNVLVRVRVRLIAYVVRPALLRGL